ncbi:MAG: hypothetical protein ABI054_13010 [Planctomycetota bacterium]
MNPAPDSARGLLRHALATLAYRAEKVVRDPPRGFSVLRTDPTARTPLELVGHLGDLLEWAETLARGDAKWKASSLGDWEKDLARFFAALARLDELLASDAALGGTTEQIFQGPIADAFTHVGQLALLRRCAGAPVKPESFARAEIATGRVGRDQSSIRKEFEGDASAK